MAEEESLRWRSDKSNRLANFVGPGTPVRIASLARRDDDQLAQVFHIPEPLIRRLLVKLRGRAGELMCQLEMSDPGNGRPISEQWEAAELPPPSKPSRFVAVAPAGHSSGELSVSGPVEFEIESPRLAAEANIDLSPASMAAVGAPLPLKVSGSVERPPRHLRGIAYAVEDPELRVDWMTSGSAGVQLTDYLEPYLNDLARGFEIDADELRHAFETEYSDWLMEQGELGAEFNEHLVTLSKGEARAIDVLLYPHSPGSCLAAVALTDIATEELVAVSDLMGFTVSEEKLLFRDF